MKKLCALFVVLVLALTPAMAEKIYKMDDGIKAVAKTLSGKLPKGTKVVIINIKSDKSEASTYIIEQLTYELLELGNLVVVDRENLEAIRTELSLQTSGDVSDDSAQRLGAMLGAETLVSGSFDVLSDKYRLACKAVKVETSEIQYLSSLSISSSPETEALFGKLTGKDAAVKAVGKAARGVVDFTGRFICSSINPIIGLGSFIQGDTDGGGNVVFWEVVGAGALYYGTYRQDNDLSNGALITYAGGAALVGAVIYAYIRPWTYNRNPELAEALDNVRISNTSLNDISIGYEVAY